MGVEKVEGPEMGVPEEVVLLVEAGEAEEEAADA